MIVMQHEIVAAGMPLTAERGVCRLPRMFRYLQSSRKQLIFFYSCSPFLKSSSSLKSVLFPSCIHIPAPWCLLAVPANKPSAHPTGNLRVPSQDAHTRWGGVQSFLPPAGQVAAIDCLLSSGQAEEVALWATQRAAAHRFTLLLQEDTFQQYVKPEVNPKLSNFCIGLTGITQVISTSSFPWGKNEKKRCVDVFEFVWYLSGRSFM